MSSKGVGKRLSESQRLDIIRKLQKANAPSKQAIAREYHVSEGAIRNIWNNRDHIKERKLSIKTSQPLIQFIAAKLKIILKLNNNFLLKCFWFY